MKTFIKSIIAITALCIMQAASLASTVTVEAGTVRGATGSKVEVPINLKGAQKFGAIQMELAYDPALLETQDKQIEKGGFSQEISVGSHVVAPGLLRIVMNGSASNSISGDGTLLRAIFTVKGQTGQSCDLRIISARAWDNVEPKAEPAEMLVTLQHGKFTVGMVIPLWMWIAAGVLLLLVLSRLLRKKQRPQNAMAAPQPGGFCPHCGGAAVAGAKFCNSCGKPL